MDAFFSWFQTLWTNGWFGGTIILGNTHIDHTEMTFCCNLPLNKDLDRSLSVRIPKRLLDEATTTGGGWETGGKARGGCNGLTSRGSLKWQVDGLIAGSFMIFFSASCIENSYLRSNWWIIRKKIDLCCWVHCQKCFFLPKKNKSREHWGNRRMRRFGRVCFKQLVYLNPLENSLVQI